MAPIKNHNVHYLLLGFDGHFSIGLICNGTKALFSTTLIDVFLVVGDVAFLKCAKKTFCPELFLVHVIGLANKQNPKHLTKFLLERIL